MTKADRTGRLVEETVVPVVEETAVVYKAELEQCRVNVPGTTARKSLIVLGGFFGRR